MLYIDIIIATDTTELTHIYAVTYHSILFTSLLVGPHGGWMD